MQVLAETMADLKERMQGKQHAAIHSLVDQVTHGLNRFVARSRTGIDSLDQAALQGLADEADGLETQWHDLEHLFDASTRRGEQVQRELVAAHYRARFVGLEQEVGRWQLVAQERSRLDQQSVDGSLVRLRADLSAVEAKIEVFEAAHLDGWRALRRGLQRAFQRLEKTLSALEEELG